jgi:hypothetical protein
MGLKTARLECHIVSVDSNPLLASNGGDIRRKALMEPVQKPPTPLQISMETCLACPVFWQDLSGTSILTNSQKWLYAFFA